MISTRMLGDNDNSAQTPGSIKAEACSKQCCGWGCKRLRYGEGPHSNFCIILEVILVNLKGDKYLIKETHTFTHCYWPELTGIPHAKQKKHISSRHLNGATSNIKTSHHLLPLLCVVI